MRSGTDSPVCAAGRQSQGSDLSIEEENSYGGTKGWQKKDRAEGRTARRRSEEIDAQEICSEEIDTQEICCEEIDTEEISSEEIDKEKIGVKKELRQKIACKESFTAQASSEEIEPPIDRE